MASYVNPSSWGGAGEANASGAGEASTSAPNQTTLRHNPGTSLEWTLAEQCVLENLLEKYASEPSVMRYAIISQQLIDKTVRDVAMRCKWMNERVTDPFPKSSQEADRISECGISFKAIGGVAGQILEQNALAMDQISANFSDCKIYENIDLLRQTRNNILSILDSLRLTVWPEEIKNMPHLHVKLDDDPVNFNSPHSFLPYKT